MTDRDVMLDAILQGGTAADRAWVRARHRDHPKHARVAPGRLSAFLALGLPTGYVAATEDRTIPLGLARRFSPRLGAPVHREIPGSHDVTISRPEDAATALVEIARSCGA